MTVRYLECFNITYNSLGITVFIALKKISKIKFAYGHYFAISS